MNIEQKMLSMEIRDVQAIREDVEQCLGNAGNVELELGLHLSEIDIDNIEHIIDIGQLENWSEYVDGWLDMLAHDYMILDRTYHRLKKVISCRNLGYLDSDELVKIEIM